MDLLVQINTVPSRTPITVVWNKNLPHYDSTRNDQTFKTFTFLTTVKNMKRELVKFKLEERFWRHRPDGFTVNEKEIYVVEFKRVTDTGAKYHGVRDPETSGDSVPSCQDTSRCLQVCDMTFFRLSL